jgi:predicted nucleic acid-binding Zn ribbon protein
MAKRSGRGPHTVALSCLLWLSASRLAGANPAIDQDHHRITGVRDARYCELIPIVRSGARLLATIYNTLGLNDCPAEIWSKISEADMKRRFDAVKVVLNGPRYFVMDSIEGAGETVGGKTIEAAGLSLTERASINVTPLDRLREPYRETTINRATKYLFMAGKQVFILQAPNGGRCAMQAYSQIVDKSLSYADLANLGDRLKLPPKWRYFVVTPDQDLIVGAKGKAIVVQDELQNTYQKLD